MPDFSNAIQIHFSFPSSCPPRPHCKSCMCVGVEGHFRPLPLNLYARHTQAISPMSLNPSLGATNSCSCFSFPVTPAQSQGYNFPHLKSGAIDLCFSVPLPCLPSIQYLEDSLFCSTSRRDLQKCSVIKFGVILAKKYTNIHTKQDKRRYKSSHTHLGQTLWQKN